MFAGLSDQDIKKDGKFEKQPLQPGEVGNNLDLQLVMNN
jgi:hypothetical protein